MKSSILTPPGAPRLVDCYTCQGRGAARLTVDLPTGRRSKAFPSLCPSCSGTGARLHTRSAA